MKNFLPKTLSIFITAIVLLAVFVIISPIFSYLVSFIPNSYFSQIIYLFSMYLIGSTVFYYGNDFLTKFFTS